MTTDILGKVQWYIGKGGAETWSGPFTDSEVVRHLQSGQLSWVDAIWTQGFGQNWKRICDLADFRAHFPDLPSIELIQKIGEQQAGAGGAANLSDKMDRAIWSVQYDGSEFGPLTLAEVEAIVKRGKLTAQLTAWRSGFSKWLPVQEIPEFQPFLRGQEGQTARLEIRHAERKPFMATIRFTSIRAGGDKSAQVFTGVARDISTSGMRITTDNVPKAMGMGLLIHVQPSTDEIPEFKVEAEVARIVGERVFAVRFRNLDPKILKAILEFTSQSDPAHGSNR